MIARYLEFDYIWIDCLCIVQDDREDWNREAARMAKVYSNASLTIAASVSPNCDNGFLYNRKMAPWVPVHFEDVEGSFELMIMPYARDTGKYKRWRTGYDPLLVRRFALEYLLETTG
jgi:hypothetical protein